MSTIDFNQLIGSSPLDMAPADPISENPHPDPNGSFNDYLQRAGGSPSTAPPLPKGDVNENDDLGKAESASEANISQSNKKEEDNKKDKRDGRDSAAAAQNQENKSDMQINPVVASAKKHSPLDKDTPEAQEEITGRPDLPLVTSNDAKTKSDSNTKTIADAGTLTKAVSAAAEASQTSAAEQMDLSFFASLKGGTAKKTAPGNGKYSDKTTVEKPAGDPVSASGESGKSSAKISKDNPAPARDFSRKSSLQNEKTEPPTTALAEAAVSPIASQETPAGAPSVNPVDLKAVVNLPATLKKSAENKIDARTTNIESNIKAGDPANALPRLEQSAAKASAGMSHRNGDETGSQVDRVRFVQRVQQAFSALGDRGGAVRLKLSPPELGSVRMEITVNKGVMNARLEAETKETKNLLLENLPALRDRLAQQNIKIQKFDVDLRDPSSGGMPQHTPGQAETGSGDGGYRATRPQFQEKNAAATPAADTVRLADHNGQLNVII